MIGKLNEIPRSGYGPQAFTRFHVNQLSIQYLFFHWFVECRTSGHKRGGDLFFTSKKRKEKKIEPNWVGPAGLMINTRRLFLKMSATTILLDSEVLDCIGALRARELASEWRRGRKLPIRALTRIFLLRTVTSLFIESRLNRRQRHPASLFSTPPSSSHPPPGHYLPLIEGHLYHYHYCLLCKQVNRRSFSDVPIVLQACPATNNKWNCGKQRSTLYKRRCKIEFNKQNCTNGIEQIELYKWRDTNGIAASANIWQIVPTHSRMLFLSQLLDLYNPLSIINILVGGL